MPMLQTLQAAVPNSWLSVLLTAVASYLLGSISSAVIVSRCLYREDVREKGSGNAGATNMLRNYGAKAAVFTTLGDLAKSILSVFIGGWLLIHLQLTGTPEISEAGLRIVGRYLAGVCCVLGHLYPVYFGFRGGKGVMTSLGMIIILDWRVALLCLAVFGVVLAISRMVSLSSVTAMFVAPFLVYVFTEKVDHQSPEATWFCTLMIALISVIVIVKHRANLARIVKGTESRISFCRKHK